ncbi:hypothetical protein F5X68DRAFT_247000 [Plectosphaerella plurivora]|uniref:Uncharacterized protein n=1 Tax=Plectosphaerella plurivora TaxID=936078 RepID=A0A9P9A7T2_9PEZI|nr:hypothetical protein F5X68DRAFT_247000 [Plectosphaerella plurivora]
MASTLSSIALQLPGTLLDDALAIVQFPCPEAIDDDPEIVDRHLETWVSGQISQSECDEQTHCALQRLCEKMTFYIEDYVSKATSPFLPRAYLDIPSPLPQTQTGEKHGIRMKDLSSGESNRLMTAFVEYELLCKMNYCCRFETKFDFRALERFTGRAVSPWRAETLNCVFEYIRSIYGALFVHSANAWLPTDHTQLVFPDNILFSVGQQMQVYRQRAWVFFDDERLFPESSGLMPTFPTAEEIMSAEAQTIQQYINPNTARANHRSRFWHETKMPPYMDPARTAMADEDPWAGKDGTTEELLRGLHKALKPRLTPFWK